MTSTIPRARRAAASLLFGGGLALATLSTITAHAATINVPCTGTNATDIAALNAAITAAASGDVINLGSGCTFTYSVAAPSGTATPDITAAITINGNGDTITRSTAGGTPNFGLFDISTGGLTLTDTVLSNGNAGNGGAIFSQDGQSLVLTNDTLVNNTGGEGGGVDAEAESGSAPALVVGSYFANNTGGNAGGMRSDVPVTIINSTFTGNTATNAGAVGGFDSSGSTATLINDTFDGNSATGGGSTGGGVGNEAGVATIAFSNDIVTGNTGNNCSPTMIVTDNGYNLEQGTSCGFSNHNVNTDPGLAAPANNGGPTFTQAITSSSSAYHTANPTACTTAVPNGAGGVDQRGLPRFSPAGDGVCDIGAFAVQAATTPTPTATPLPVPPTGVADGGGAAPGLPLVGIGVTAVVLGGLACLGFRRPDKID